MNISRVSRNVALLALAATTLFSASVAQAQQSSIFPAGWDNKIRDRLFMRLGYTTAFLKTKAEEARDITGNAVSVDQLLAAGQLGAAISTECEAAGFFNDFSVGPNYSFDECLKYADGNNGFTYGDAGLELLTDELQARGMSGLGTPPGIKAKTQSSAGTPTVSVGYWLDEDRHWLLEGFVLAQPLTVKIYGDGVRENGTPTTLNGKHIVTTKILPPLVIGSYNFGDKRSVVRPYVGVGAMYAVFFGARTTGFFETYLGGRTTVSTKNAFGVGPFVGVQSSLNSDWHVNLSVGQIGLNTTSRLVTTGTQITSESAVLKDFPTEISRLILVSGESVWADARSDQAGKFTTAVMDLVKRTSGDKPDLGTYVREQKMKITNTIVTFSVGRSF